MITFLCWRQLSGCAESLFSWFLYLASVSIDWMRVLSSGIWCVRIASVNERVGVTFFSKSGGEQQLIKGTRWEKQSSNCQAFTRHPSEEYPVNYQHPKQFVCKNQSPDAISFGCELLLWGRGPVPDVGGLEQHI